jgi:hypothetical protein
VATSTCHVDATSIQIWGRNPASRATSVPREILVEAESTIALGKVVTPSDTRGMDLNEVFTAIPCCACNDPRRDRILGRMGAVYLTLARGGTLAKIPTLAEILRGCCRQSMVLSVGEVDPASTTFILPQKRARR